MKHRPIPPPSNFRIDVALFVTKIMSIRLWEWLAVNALFPGWKSLRVRTHAAEPVASRPRPRQWPCEIADDVTLYLWSFPAWEEEHWLQVTRHLCYIKLPNTFSQTYVNSSRMSDQFRLLVFGIKGIENKYLLFLRSSDGLKEVKCMYHLLKHKLQLAKGHS